MSVFPRLVCTAVCAGLLCGILAGVMHQLLTVPLILRAEAYEARGHSAAAARSTAPSENRIERMAATFAADVLAAIGFALLLGAGMALRGGDTGWREGLLWGLAGFAMFTLAPSLGLPPDLPGSAAAPLIERQLWWLASAFSTGGGLALLLFTRQVAFAALAVLLIALPQFYGAPHPAGHMPDLLPEALVHRFTTLVIAISFLFWAALGASTGYSFRRLAARPQDED